MSIRSWLATAIVIILNIVSVSSAFALSVVCEQADDVRALDGVWIYVEDRTAGRAVEEHQPSMSPRVTLRVEDDAVVLVRSNGEIRMSLDGTAVEVAREGSASRYSGEWKDGAFAYQSVPMREPGDTRNASVIRWELRVTDEGLIASVAIDPGWKSVALYRHPEDIEMPAPAAATINEIAWLGGAWVGTRGTGGAISIEEHWTPPLGGSMLGVSRTVSRGAMRAFEYLRVVERDGGLVYVAQPNGAKATEFVLTEISATRAVFLNPRHDSPQRITYELTAEGGLTASIGYVNGGRPRPFEYTREED